jgi:hypothetical protein
MSLYTFTIATPQILATLTPQLGPPGSFDYYIDPRTNDYVRTTDGDWLLTADSRTAVYLMHEIEFGASPFTPGDGSIVKALVRTGEPITSDVLKSEAERIGQILTRAGILTGMTVAVTDAAGNDLVDEFGRQVVLERWIDLASGSPIDAFYTPR